MGWNHVGRLLTLPVPHRNPVGKGIRQVWQKIYSLDWAHSHDDNQFALGGVHNSTYGYNSKSVCWCL